ncbi:MAG: Fe2+-dependent dioxygenase [Pseudomonadota bacterium]
MITHIKQVINPQQLAVVRNFLDQQQFVDGKISAQNIAANVKNNQELVQNNSPQINSINNIVMGSLIANDDYKATVLMKKIGLPFYAKYLKGMSYGGHIDNPIMGQQGQYYRTDVSTTIFLNQPDEYQGGEVVIKTNYGEQGFKLPAGDALVYPSTSWHYVKEVIEGQRLVCVTWAQSMVREANKREILYELYQAKEKLLRENPLAEETRHIDVTYTKLMQLWADV